MDGNGLMIVWFVVGLIFGIGYLLNAIKLIRDAIGSLKESILMIILRIVGLFVPILGGVIGWNTGQPRTTDLNVTVKST